MHEWTGKEIRALRELLEMTQPEFSEALGISVAYVSYLENEKRRPSKILCLSMERLKKATRKGARHEKG
jgi:DNA-binding transcriptional regulator YiaG